MPLASQERVEGGLPIRSRLVAPVVAIGRDSVAIGRFRADFVASIHTHASTQADTQASSQDTKKARFPTRGNRAARVAMRRASLAFR